MRRSIIPGSVSAENIFVSITDKLSLKCAAYNIFCKTWLNVKCAAARVDSSLPDHSHAHVSNNQKSQRPSVSARAVHRLQNDCKCVCFFSRFFYWLLKSITVSWITSNFQALFKTTGLIVIHAALMKCWNKQIENVVIQRWVDMLSFWL